MYTLYIYIYVDAHYIILSYIIICCILCYQNLQPRLVIQIDAAINPGNSGAPLKSASSSLPLSFCPSLPLSVCPSIPPSPSLHLSISPSLPPSLPPSLSLSSKAFVAEELRLILHPGGPVFDCRGEIAGAQQTKHHIVFDSRSSR